MENCQVLCNYKNTKILIQEPPKFLLKPPPTPPFEYLRLNATSLFLNNYIKCEKNDIYFNNKFNATASITRTSNIATRLPIKIITKNSDIYRNNSINANNSNNTQLNNDYNLFIILLYICLILILLLIIFAIVYLVITRRNLKLKLKKEQQQNNLDNNTFNKFHTIISNLTSSPTITGTTATSTALSAPVITGFIPDLQLNNSNTSSTSSYEYYMNSAFKLNKPQLQQHQQRNLDYQQKQKLLNNGYPMSNESDALVSKLDYYTLRMNKNKLIKCIDDETSANLKPLLDINNSITSSTSPSTATTTATLNNKNNYSSKFKPVNTKLLSNSLSTTTSSSSPHSSILNDTNDIYSNKYATIYDDNNEKYILIPKNSYLTYEKVKLLKNPEHQMTPPIDTSGTTATNGKISQTLIIPSTTHLSMNEPQNKIPLLILYNQNYFNNNSNKVYESLNDIVQVNNDSFYENNGKENENINCKSSIDIIYEHIIDEQMNDSLPPKTTFNSCMKKYPKTNPNL